MHRRLVGTQLRSASTQWHPGRRTPGRRAVPAPSLARMCSTWAATACGAMTNAAAMRALDQPSTSSPRTTSSWPVSPRSSQCPRDWRGFQSKETAQQDPFLDVPHWERHCRDLAEQSRLSPPGADRARARRSPRSTSRVLTTSPSTSGPTTKACWCSTARDWRSLTVRTAARRFGRTRALSLRRPAPPGPCPEEERAECGGQEVPRTCHRGSVISPMAWELTNRRRGCGGRWRSRRVA